MEECFINKNYVKLHIYIPEFNYKIQLCKTKQKSAKM